MLAQEVYTLVFYLAILNKALSLSLLVGRTVAVIFKMPKAVGILKSITITNDTVY